MVSTTAAFSAITFAVLATSTGVDAHGVLAKPGPTFTGSGYGGNFHATVPNSALKPVPGEKFTHYPDANLIANSFEKSFKVSQYKTLKDFLLKNMDMSKGRSNMPKTKECGFTNPNGKAQTLPDQLEWYGGVQNHPGPCEAWCDDTNVLPFTANCAKTFPAGKMKYNKAACAGKGRLTFYWMSSLLEWQVYIQCIKLSGGARSIEDSDDGKNVPALYNATAYEGATEAADEQEAEDMAAIARSYDLYDDDETEESVGISDAEVEEEAEVQAAIEREAAEAAGPSAEELAEDAEVQDALDREAAEEEAAKHVDDEDN